MNWKKWKWIPEAVLFSGTAFLGIMTTTTHLYKKAFGRRVDNDSGLYEYMARIHPDFKRKPDSFLSNKGQKLQGYFYYKEGVPPKGLIVLAHGMGGGHCNYLPEAEYFVKNGYLVYSYDNTGTNESEGARLIGLSQSAIDLRYALAHLETLPQVKSLTLLLYGHSWGGYAVAAVHCFPNAAKGVVSVAGFEKNSNVLKAQGALLVGKAINFYMPFVHLYEERLFGKDAPGTGIDGLKKTRAKVLFVHSQNDPVVSYEDNFMKYREAFADNPQFSFMSLPSSGHNVTLPPALFEKVMGLEQQKNKLSATESKEWQDLNETIHALRLQLDTEIMEPIVRFFNEIVEQG